MYLSEEILLRLNKVTDPNSSGAKEVIENYYADVNDLTLLAVKEYTEKNPNDETFKQLMSKTFKALTDEQFDSSKLAFDPSIKSTEKFFELLTQKVENYNLIIIAEKISYMTKSQIEDLIKFLGEEQNKITLMSLKFREDISNILLNSLEKRTLNTTQPPVVNLGGASSTGGSPASSI